MNLAFLENIGPSELLIILVIILLLFGANRLPDLARSLGRSVNEFKKGRDEKPADDEKTSSAGKDGQKPDGR